MKVQGWQRGIIARSMSEEDFFKHVANLISLEFEQEVCCSCCESIFTLSMEDYLVKLSKIKVNKLQHAGGYALDKYILEELERQGLNFDRLKSHYLRCVFSLLTPEDDIKIIPARPNSEIRFSHIFNVEIPEGDLFYPCCGRDTYEPLKLFLNKIEKFHFADIDNVTLPYLECGVDVKSKRAEKNIYLEERRRVGIISQKTVTSAVQERLKGYIDIGDGLKHNCRLDFGSVLLKNKGKLETWTLGDLNKNIRIYCHNNDAALTLLTINKIAVFYYRGDSMGEGGSGQWWLGPDLFKMILNKLVSGGLIITDGSNPNPDYPYTPWSYLWDAENRLNNFECLGRKFTCIGKYGQKRSVYVWQVTKQRRLRDG